MNKYSEHQPVKTKDFRVGDKVVTERLGHVVVKEIYEDCVRVQASDGRFFDVLPTALCFEEKKVVAASAAEKEKENGYEK